jgi:hypothetical protein
MLKTSGNYLRGNWSTHYGCEVLQGTFCFDVHILDANRIESHKIAENIITQQLSHRLILM